MQKYVHSLISSRWNTRRYSVLNLSDSIAIHRAEYFATKMEKCKTNTYLNENEKVKTGYNIKQVSNICPKSTGFTEPLCKFDFVV